MAAPPRSTRCAAALFEVPPKRRRQSHWNLGVLVLVFMLLPRREMHMPSVVRHTLASTITRNGMAVRLTCCFMHLRTAERPLQPQQARPWQQCRRRRTQCPCGRSRRRPRLSKPRGACRPGEPKHERPGVRRLHRSQQEILTDVRVLKQSKSSLIGVQVDVIPVLSQMKSAFQVGPRQLAAMRLYTLIHRTSSGHQAAPDSCRMHGICPCSTPAVCLQTHQDAVHPMLSSCAAQLACGDKEGAKKTQSNMTKGCPGISQVGCTLHGPC
jgi:hypothetical protein